MWALVLRTLDHDHVTQYQVYIMYILISVVLTPNVANCNS